MRFRRVLPPIILTCLVVSLISATAAARRKQTPSMSTDLYVGSLTCILYLYADEDWYVNSSVTLVTPSNRVLNSCADDNYGFMIINNHVNFPQYYRPGIYKCSAVSYGSSSMGGNWSDAQYPEVYIPNPECGCTPEGVNHALTIPQSDLSGYYVAISDYEQANRVLDWYHQGRQWWNDELSASGSTKQIAWTGPYPIYIEDLPNNEAMRWEQGGFGRRIRIDPEVFDLDDAFAKTLMAHEVGHAVGVSGHVPAACEGGALMSSGLSGPLSGLHLGDRCFVHSEHGTFTKSCSW